MTAHQESKKGGRCASLSRCELPKSLGEGNEGGGGGGGRGGGLGGGGGGGGGCGGGGGGGGEGVGGVWGVVLFGRRVWREEVWCGGGEGGSVVVVERGGGGGGRGVVTEQQKGKGRKEKCEMGKIRKFFLILQAFLPQGAGILYYEPSSPQRLSPSVAVCSCAFVGRVVTKKSCGRTRFGRLH